MTTKVCSKCGEEKPVEAFGIRSVNPDGLNNGCRKCMASYRSEHYFKNDDYRQHRIREATKINRKRKYGITDEDFQILLNTQNSKCAICSVHLDGSIFSLKGQLDHCHVTKKVRGILCGKCNTALGLFKDDRNIMLEAISYLDRSSDDN
jgi:hypothetical protein